MLTSDYVAVVSRVSSLADYGHRARNTRLGRILALMLAHPDASIPAMMEDHHQAKLCYAFLSHPQVLPEATHKAAFAVTAERCVGVDTVLLIGDDTQLDLTSHPATRALGTVGDGVGRGLFVHGLLAVRAGNHEVLGPADVQVWTRPPRVVPLRRQNTAHRRHRERESQVWSHSVDNALPRLRATQPPAGGTRWIMVGDCAADNFSYLSNCVACGVGFVQRAYQDRVLLDDEGQRTWHLLETIKDAPVREVYSLDVPAQPGRAKRTATMEVRTLTVTFARPRWERDFNAPLTVNVVQVREVNAPVGVEPLVWMLLTTEPIGTVAEALTVVAHYKARWLIEEWHKAIKTGCNVEARQLESRHAMENFLALALIVASELLRLRDAARRHPTVSARDWFSPLQLDVLRSLKPRLARECTLHQAIHAVGEIAGFMGSSKMSPGWRLLWQGFQRLIDAERMFRAGMRNQQRLDLLKRRKSFGE